jgi:hypothetical protein
MPSSKHPLRAVRAATPHTTQSAFAAFLGVPVTSVQAVETGKARMTARMAALVREKTGADDMELLRGTDGQAVTLERRRYTAEAFSAWQGSLQQRMETARRTRAEQTCATEWQRHAVHADSGEGREDYLAPWQTCEFVSASAREWRRLPDSRKRLTGWSASLPLPPLTRLTLAMQAAPAWDSTTAPPGMAAANADLFPPCYFTVATGSGGCRMAARFWQVLCREHAILPESGAPRTDHGPSGSWRGFFRPRSGHYEPHAIFAGLDAAEAGELGSLFAGGGILSRETGSTLAEGVLQFMMEHSEDAGSPAGILLFASLEGGTASALGSELLERLREQFPAMPILVIGVLPLAGVSPVVTAPWHLALALQAIRRHASAALLFGNDQLLTQASRDWALPSPGYAEANLLIAECLSALTAPLRFGGTDTPPVDLRAILDCLAGEQQHCPPIVTGRCWPLAAFADRRLKRTTLPHLVERVIRAGIASQMTGAEAVAAFLRVKLQPGDEWTQDDSPPVVSLSGRVGPGLHESASVFGGSPVIQRTLERQQKQAMELLKLENAAALCAQLGVEPGDLLGAVNEMSARDGRPGSRRRDAQ